MDKIIVGSNGCEIKDVISTLSESISFHLIRESLFDFSQYLNTKQEYFKTLQMQLQNDQISLVQTVDSIIQKWVARQGSNAKLSVITSALTESGLKACAEELERRFVEVRKESIAPTDCIPKKRIKLKKSPSSESLAPSEMDNAPLDLSKDKQTISQHGQVVIDGMIEENNINIPIARTVAGTERILNKPNKRCPLEIKCAGNNCNPKENFKWHCIKCKDIIEYGFDNFVYCGCGKTLATSLEFKCTDPNHGVAFERYSEEFLTDLLDTLRPFPEINILILGETGVGKSTWINGFINFLTYESLEEAEKGELCTLIPSEFTVCSEDYEEITVTTGEDKDEVFQTGQSATQVPKVYPFNVGNTTIRLIDTPGIGDTRGIDQDKKNFQNILGTLSHLDEIHGICILLKPNNARLNVMFRFCIKELLTYLHRDASKNIIFCFTNSRGTFCRPGDTMPALKKLLSENKDVELPFSRSTVYCYDSEAYRFLAAVKNNPPVKFADDERSNFAKSWEMSIAETSRMLKHIKEIKPHSIKSTLNLNHSRELVLKLARPLAEISRNIQTNKSIVEDEKKKILATKASIRELQKRRYTTRTAIETERIDHPKTVCSNTNCVKIWKFNDVQTTEYITECHNPCELTDVKEDSVGDPRLRECGAMKDSYCIRLNCRHHYREHLHIYYDSVQIQKQVEDSSVVESMNKNLSAAKMKQKMIANKNREIQEYKSELDEIEKASVRFAYFLKSNAITPYNDAIEQYLSHLIREEKNKVAQGGREMTLKNLEISKDSYVAQRNILEQEMGKGGGSPPKPADVEALVKKLQNLKHSGKALKTAMECVDHARNVEYRESVVKQPAFNNNIREKKENSKGLLHRLASGISKNIGW